MGRADKIRALRSDSNGRSPWASAYAKSFFEQSMTLQTLLPFLRQWHIAGNAHLKTYYGQSRSVEVRLVKRDLRDPRLGSITFNQVLQHEHEPVGLDQYRRSELVVHQSLRNLGACRVAKSSRK